MRVCGPLHHSWPLTVNRTSFCGAPVLAELFDVALTEEKRRAVNNIVGWLAVARWNYTINSVCVTASRTAPVRPDVGCLCLNCHASG
jgi:hypothetical protein